MRLAGLICTLSAVVLTGCGVIKATEGMPDKMDQTLVEMNKTNDTVRKQGVQVAIEGLQKAENGEDLTPIPFGLMPYAKALGEFANPDEFVELVYLWMKQLNEVQLDDSTKPSQAQIDAFNHHKMQILSALQAACGLLPEAKIQQIIGTEIDNDGRFADSARDMLMLRVRFLRDVLLQNSLFSTPMDDVGKLEKAIEYADSIDKIGRLPFAKDMALKIGGFHDPLPTIQEAFDPGLALTEWSKIEIKAQNYLDVSEKSKTGNPAQDKALAANNAARADRAMSTVVSRIKSWGGTP
jgi:hypothetical protein